MLHDDEDYHILLPCGEGLHCTRFHETEAEDEVVAVQLLVHAMSVRPFGIAEFSLMIQSALHNLRHYEFHLVSIVSMTF
jgi:hypothetical protein